MLLVFALPRPTLEGFFCIGSVIYSCSTLILSVTNSSSSGVHSSWHSACCCVWRPDKICLSFSGSCWTVFTTSSLSPSSSSGLGSTTVEWGIGILSFSGPDPSPCCSVLRCLGRHWRVSSFSSYYYCWLALLPRARMWEPHGFKALHHCLWPFTILKLLDPCSSFSKWCRS